MIFDRYQKRIHSTRFLMGIFLIFLFLIIGLLPMVANGFDILLGTGKSGTLSHFTGRAICRVINKQTDEIHCTPIAAPGDMHNLTNLQGGSLDIALIDSRMLHDAISKSGYFEFLDIDYDALQLLMTLYDKPITLVVRSDAAIASLEGLKGKRINAGAPRSVQHLAMDTIMNAKNWSKDDFSLVEELSNSQSQDTMAICYGTIQAMVHIGAHPDASLQKLLKLCKVRLADMKDEDIERMIQAHPAFTRFDISAGTYPTQQRAVVTFGSRALLVASKDLDEQTVYKIMDAIYSNRKRLQSVHPALSRIDSAAGRETTVGVPLHAGAARYFSEHPVDK